MALQHYAKHRHLVPTDAIFELRRARDRVGSKPDGRKWLRDLERKDSMDKVYKTMLLSLLTMGDNKVDPLEVKTESNDVVELMERPVQVKNRKRKCSIIDQHDDRGRTRISEKNKALVPLGNDGLHHRNIKENKQVIRLPSDHVARVQTVKIYTGKIGGKVKGVVKQEHEANEKKPLVKKENEKIQDQNSATRYFCQVVGRVRDQPELRKVVRGDSSKKVAFGNFAVKKESDHCVETRLPIKGIYSQVRNVERAKCSPTYIIDERYLEEGEGSSKTVPEVIILDGDRVVKKELVSPFVSSKRYHISMTDEEFKNHGIRRTIDSEFRTELLKVLRKPFDKEELKMSREAFRSGSYADYHPDVQRKLVKYRYKREKCLIILRGFLFWLQNLCREGVFQPWKDKQYLELELPSH